MELIDIIGKPAVLEQLAEECSELSQAALKLSRKYRGENPTPKTEELCLKAVNEEVADVMCCLQQLGGVINWRDVHLTQKQKMERWENRVMKGCGD